MERAIASRRVPRELSQALGAPSSTGAIISGLDASGPASAASLHIGDVLEKIDGTQLADSRAFNRAIIMIPVGQPAQLTIRRDGKQQEVIATVAAWPNYMPYGGMMHGAMAESMMAKPPDSGMKLAALTDETRKQYGIAPTQSGAVITSVDPDCEAKDLGIVPGDVIIAVQSDPVTSPADFDRAVQDAHAQQRRYLAVLIKANQVTRWVSLSITTTGS